MERRRAWRPKGASNLLSGNGWATTLALLALAPLAAHAEGELGQAPVELEGRFHQLLEWLQPGLDAADFGGAARPGRLDATFRLGVGRFGRSLIAARDFEAGDTITLLPLSHIIHNGQYSEGLDGLEPNQQAAVYLSQQRSLGAASPWAKYLAMMPTSYADLPKHWDQAWLRQQMEGSQFPEYVKVMHDEVKQEWEQANAMTGISWEDYEWAHDSLQTRSVYWNSAWVGDNTPRARKSSAFIPLFDLLMHAIPNNADFKFSVEAQAMRLFAKAPIQAGDELTIPYFEPEGSRSNTEILNKWGFATDGGLKLVEVQMQALEPSAETPREDTPIYALEQTARDGAATAFLGHLRALADNRGIHLAELPEGWLAIPDPRTGWLYYWSEATDEVTWERPGVPDGASKPYFTPATTWGTEVAALTLAKDILEKHLAKYPTTLRADIDLLAGKISDVRLRFLALIRRNEKQVLDWWLKLVQRAIDNAPAPETEVDAMQAYLDMESGQDAYKHAADEL